VKAFEAGLDESTLEDGTHTLAFGLNVPKALGDFLVLRGVRESGGTAIAVTDDAILDELRQLAATEGTWICPEGAACLAAVRQLREDGWIREHERVVVLNTGAGLKYPETVSVDVPAWGSRRTPCNPCICCGDICSQRSMMAATFRSSVGRRKGGCYA